VVFDLGWTMLRISTVVNSQRQQGGVIRIGIA
jgi:hypothetical protein